MYTICYSYVKQAIYVYFIFNSLRTVIQQSLDGLRTQIKYQNLNKSLILLDYLCKMIPFCLFEAFVVKLKKSSILTYQENLWFDIGKPKDLEIKIFFDSTRIQYVLSRRNFRNGKQLMGTAMSSQNTT